MRYVLPVFVAGAIALAAAPAASAAQSQPNVGPTPDYIFCRYAANVLGHRLAGSGDQERLPPQALSELGAHAVVAEA